MFFINAKPPHVPWNKGKIIGQKPPLKPKHVWAIRTRLQMDGRRRDLAMFNLAIDSKLRGCDLVRLKVDDIAPHSRAVNRATVRQRKTGGQLRSRLRTRREQRWTTTCLGLMYVEAYTFFLVAGARITQSQRDNMRDVFRHGSAASG
ncbi:MAG: hypothetical protein RIC16_12895 [Rhodospirillales bacterium]